MNNSISEVRNRDFIRVKRNKKEGQIRCVTTSITFKDKDTKQMVMYVPSLELSAYGDTTENAKKMLEFQVNEFLLHLLKMPNKAQKITLLDLGWTQGKFAHKEYSNSYVDVAGTLTDFNIEDGTPIHVEQQELVAA